MAVIRMVLKICDPANTHQEISYRSEEGVDLKTRASIIVVVLAFRKKP